VEGAADVTERTRRRDSGDTTLIKARPTVYRGIEMRSRLEADFAAWLDRKGRRWVYEPQCFAGPKGQYLPDFRTPIIQPSDDPADDYGTVYIEVKPFIPDEDNAVIDEVLTRMETILLSEHDAWLELHYWTYGAERTPLKFYRVSPDGVWWEHWADDSGGIWQGMGQYVALMDLADRRLEELGR
jgi:hypothetical protein